jgi:phenylalanine-4-hydroxylase
VGESYKCLGPGVKKIPLTVECVETSYDITKPQPQLFVTPDFEHLTTVLREFEATMAFKVGGVRALQKALEAKAVTTTVLDSGLQISGKLKEYLKDGQGGVAYLSYEGPTQLSYGDTELDGQDAKYHKSGFGTAVGAVAGMGAKKISEMTQSDFEKLGFKNDKAGTLKFTSGVTITGRIKQIQLLYGKTLVVAFDHCTVKLGDRVLFDPAWGTFDLACGTSVSSVFGGAADRIRYLNATGTMKQSTQKQKTNLTATNKKLNEIYRRVAEIRASRSDAQSLSPALAKIFEDVSVQFPEDWLLSMELLELAGTHDLTDPWVARCKKHLDDFARRSDEMKNLIDRGLFLIQI